ncbi:MAG: UDP-N-acetylmuramate:L-alanyl-gamma-D-glutamyl-meso-diaminopimelate ligase [Burkholderiales bacterium]|nr:UDP-N-acetylmuramate:L-alanyl-gamma-D-glutamyl-meso-diaminopimelate ligase [Burkholderiales bacterium]
MQKHIHILGICGTFMGGIAAIAKQAGYRVTGCDANVYPPMSTQLEAQGIELISGFDAGQLDLKPDVFVIGNVVSRGNPLMEAILDAGAPYISGPQWLAENVLHSKWVLAVAGTHGKTTTSSMLAWLLEDAGLNPSFLIGGVPNNFGISARLTDDPFFVIEADEYDTAFFDKRSKFVHYRPRTVILNNLEFDHADIFADLAAIQTQFHHLVRTVPHNGLIVSNAHEAALDETLNKGAWTPIARFGLNSGSNNGTADWQIANVGDDDSFDVLFEGKLQGRVRWDVTGAHNRLNTLAAIAAARHVGVEPKTSIDALSRYLMPKRRMEIKGVVNGITVYDDFAHHPTAITTTLAGLRKRLDAQAGAGRILAVLEPRSNTMKLGVMKAALPDSLQAADWVFGYGATEGSSALGWDLAEALSPLGDKAQAFSDLDELVQAVKARAQVGDHILVMSNGGFGGVHQKLLDALQ